MSGSTPVGVSIDFAYDVFCTPTLISPTILPLQLVGSAGGSLLHFVARLRAEFELPARGIGRPTPSCHGADVDHVFAAVAPLLEAPARVRIRVCRRSPASNMRDTRSSPELRLETRVGKATTARSGYRRHRYR